MIQTAGPHAVPIKGMRNPQDENFLHWHGACKERVWLMGAHEPLRQLDQLSCERTRSCSGRELCELKWCQVCRLMCELSIYRVYSHRNITRSAFPKGWLLVQVEQHACTCIHVAACRALTCWRFLRVESWSLQGQPWDSLFVGLHNCEVASL
jgi:hypothetical protein